MLAAVNALPFDTHRVVKRLTEAGFSEPQAETVTDVLREARVSELSELATKVDLTSEIGLLRSDMLGEIGKLRSDMLGEIGKLRGDMLGEIGKLRTEMLGEIGKLRSDMNGENSKLRTELHSELGLIRAEIAKSQTDTIKWMFGMLLVQGGFIIGLIRLLQGH